MGKNTCRNNQKYITWFANNPSVGLNLGSKGLFTVSVCVSDSDVGSKWVPSISMALFTKSNAKHQGKKSRMQTQSLTVNGPLIENCTSEDSNK